MQAGHACLEAGHRFPQPEAPCHLVLLGVPSKKELGTAVEWANLHGIRCATFYEPDDDLGLTAACTEPVTRAARKLFQHLPLWQVGSHQERGPPFRAAESFTG